MESSPIAGAQAPSHSDRTSRSSKQRPPAMYLDAAARSSMRATMACPNRQTRLPFQREYVSWFPWNPPIQCQSNVALRFDPPIDRAAIGRQRLDDHEADIAERGGDPEREEVDDDHAIPLAEKLRAAAGHVARWRALPDAG